MKIFLITVLIYSLILTIINIYKDNSSYFVVESLDVIMAGPVMWIFLLLLIILKPVLKFIKSKNVAKKEWENKDQKYIAKIVKHIINQYKKKSYTDDFFDFYMYSGEYNVNDIEGWTRLLNKKAKNELLNNKFCKLMHNQKEETIAELKKYCLLLDECKLKEMNCDEYFISINKNKELLKVI